MNNKCKGCQWYGKPYWSINNPCVNCPRDNVQVITRWVDPTIEQLKQELNQKNKIIEEEIKYKVIVETLKKKIKDDFANQLEPTGKEMLDLIEELDNNNLKTNYEIKPSYTTRKLKQLEQENKQLKIQLLEKRCSDKDIEYKKRLKIEDNWNKLREYFKFEIEFDKRWYIPESEEYTMQKHFPDDTIDGFRYALEKMQELEKGSEE